MVAPQSHVDQSAELLQNVKLLLSVSPEVDPLRQSSNGRGKVFEQQPSGVFGALGLDHAEIGVMHAVPPRQFATQRFPRKQMDLAQPIRRARACVF